MENGQLPAANMPSNNGNGKRPTWLPSLINPLEDNDTLNLKDIGGAMKRYGWLVALSTIGLATAGMMWGRANPSYTSNFRLLVRSKTIEDDVVQKLAAAINSNKGGNSSSSSQEVDGTKLQMLATEPVLRPAVEKLRAKYPNIQWWQIGQNISIKAVPNSNILDIRYTDKDKTRARDVLLALGDAYVQYSLEDPKADVQKAKEFIDSQLPRLNQRVNQLQTQLQEFRQENNFFEPTAQSGIVSDQLGLFRKNRLDNQVALDQAIARLNEIQSANVGRPGEGKVALALSENARYQSLLGQLATLDNQIAEKSAIFQPDHEEVKILTDQRAKIVPMLEAEALRVEGEAKSRVKDLQARNQSLLEKEAMLTQTAKGLGRLARQYTDIQRELQIATENLNQLQSTRSALDLNNAQRQTPWQVIMPPGNPKLTSVNQYLVIGGLTGLGLGTLLAIAADRRKNVFHDAESIKRLYKLPILGEVPYNRELGSIQPLNLAQATFAANGKRKFGMLPFLESLRSVQTNLRLLNADSPIRSIVISSATPQDGKSTLAAYLAQVAASMGNRVLLVDAEMRRPQIHTRMGLQNTRGLSDLLVSNASPRDYILAGNDNVSVLTAGQLPPDPVGLLSSQRMQQLMDQFVSEYDLVIYDTPPLGGFADAHLVATRTNGLVLVSRVGKTDRAALGQVMEGLKMLPTSVLGLVINDVRQPISQQRLYTSYYNFQAPDKSSQAIGLSGTKR
jgi:capsular exopolysaccharide synthesis family protein